MKIILFGAPGSGKGTQAIALSEHYKLKRISLGDIFREEVKKDSPLGKEVKSYMEKGLLVPDILVSKVIEENLNEENFILDGYPRNLNQAKTLDKILVKKGASIDAFIYLEVDEPTILERLTKRLVCKQCGANYHMVNMPPKKTGICDSCGSELIQRKDDTPEVIKKRWEVFLNENKSLLDYYKKKNKLIAIDARGNKDIVLVRIKKLI
ncbi:MAG: adenylate kinase [Candidatus Omnitrophica bacterium]|jgi:adenylate kinase|nr:adenylate kinase [Candidatus Omnitrophota bacterium]